MEKYNLIYGVAEATGGKICCTKPDEEPEAENWTGSEHIVVDNPMMLTACVPIVVASQAL